MAVKLETTISVPLVLPVIATWLPEGSVVLELQSLAATPGGRDGPSLLRLQLPAVGTPERDAWDGWYKHSMSGTLSARVWDDSNGHELWLDVWPARDPGAPFEWVVVAFSTVPAFLDRVRQGRSVTLSALTAACADAKANAKGGDAAAVALMASKDALHTRIKHIDSGAPTAPTAAYDWYVGTATVTGRAIEVCDAWDAFLGHANNPIAKFVPDVKRRVNSARLEQQGPSTRADLRPLDRPRTVASRLEGVEIAFRKALRQMHRDSLGPYSAPNYAVTAEQLLAEFRAFAIAARKVAPHETVFGSLIESRVNDLIVRAVTPLRSSSGALAGVPYEQQIDSIIWNNQIMPAVIEHGGVAVVPAPCVCGILEVKAGTSVGEFGFRIETLRDDVAILRSRTAVEGIGVPVLGLLIVDPMDYQSVRSGSSNNVTVLFRKVGAFDYEPNPQGIDDLLTFLYDGVLPVSRAMIRQLGGRENVPSF